VTPPIQRQPSGGQETGTAVRKAPASGRRRKRTNGSPLLLSTHKIIGVHLTLSPQTPLGTNERQNLDKLALSESNPCKPECPDVWRKTIQPDEIMAN